MFQEYAEVINANGNGKVTEIKIALVIEDAEGGVNITDLMLQGGTISTVWCGHPSEIRWTVDG